MSPTSAFDNMPNGASCAAKANCQFLRGHSFLMALPYRANFIVGESRIAGINTPAYVRFYAKNANAVNEIFRTSNAFKVFQSIVGLYSILMICFQAIKRFAMESFEHETVNLFRQRLTIFCKLHVFITRCSCSWFEQARRFLDKAANISKVADFVKSFIAENCFECFHIGSIA